MKASFLLFGVMTALLSFYTNIAFTNNESSVYPFNEVEYACSIPSFPDLPQEDDFLCADVNEDGLVNVLDIISMVNYIMGGNPVPFNLEAADINADGTINILDVISMVNIIMQLQGIPCGCVAPVIHGGQTYSTVQVGNQCWFKENLNIGTMVNSTAPGNQQQMDNGIIEKYCFNNDPSRCDIYGGLYEWGEAMQYNVLEGCQGICPVGWHIPSDGEWQILEGTVDSQYPVGDPVWETTNWRGLDAGGNLKETGFTHWIAPNTGATNESGFTALPAGYRDYWGGNFDNLGMYGTFWTSSPNTSTDAWTHELSTNHADIYRNAYDIIYGYSVRCVKGCWPEPTPANAGPDQVNIPGTSTTLAGNTPTSGTGVWLIIDGANGTIADTANPVSAFTGLAGNDYSLTWTITTACGNSADTVVISFAAGFTCGEALVDTRDGQSYATVLIGDQCWMAENLNVGEMIGSTTGGFQQSDNWIIEKYCYNNDPAQCEVYGGLYEWTEAMFYDTTEGAQGICPLGWLMPTDNQWKILEGTVDSQYPVGDPEWNRISHDRGLDAGGNLKETGTTHWKTPNTGATNSSGFTALPGGYRYNLNGHFLYLSENAHFWTSTQGEPYGYERVLYYGHAYIGRYPWFGNDYGFSVRCIKGCDELPTQADAGPDQLNLPDTSTVLQGNSPLSGSGLWYIISGTGGILDDSLSPVSGFHGLEGNEYVLAWVISTECGSSGDAVTISFAEDFTCGDLLMDDRDGQSYSTVLIGTQCWMAENLNVGTKINSTSGDFLQQDDGIIEKYCYLNDEANCDTYGGLYEWPEMMQYVTDEGAQGICPIGWHIPTDDEWWIWADFFGGATIAGGKMKSTGTIEGSTGLWHTPNTGTNESGFTGLPSGYRYYNDGTFDRLGFNGYFWSSSEYTSFAWFRLLYHNYTWVGRGYYSKAYGFSVRCLEVD
ncbi:MAG TPA: FISUMP domain-containing protein [Bacteroidales bacterium]|nr:FISUMP domain-containing protein [Bacteroidales bacterium]